MGVMNNNQGTTRVIKTLDHKNGFGYRSFRNDNKNNLPKNVENLTFV